MPSATSISLRAAAAALLLSGTSLAAGTTTGKYTDTASGIDFVGFADGTGFQFGMALPSAPSTDLIIQLVTPLTNGGGWGAVDFGKSMTGPLMIATWPSNGGVLISPRVATGKSVATGANAYTAEPVTLSPISAGTFVNSTHVSATFVCGGCINGDSFKATDAAPTFSYAYSKTAVADPTNVNTRLSDHTGNGEPYGPFTVTLSDAESATYTQWASLATASNSTASTSNTTTSTGSTTGTTTATEAVEVEGIPTDSAFWVGMSLIFVVYAATPFLS